MSNRINTFTSYFDSCMISKQIKLTTVQLRTSADLPLWLKNTVKWQHTFEIQNSFRHDQRRSVWIHLEFLKRAFLNMTNIHGCVEGCRSGAETFLQTNLNDLKTHAVSFRPVSQSSRSRHIFAEKGQRGAEESGIRPRRSALELCVNSQKKNKQKKKRQGVKLHT